VTVITLTFRPDGSFDLSQNLLRIPGAHYDELVTNIGYGRTLRDLQLGQRLYDGGELVERAQGSQLLTDLLYAKWTDPVLGCMGYFAGLDTGLIGADLLEAAARNLYHYFGDSADACVIHGLAFPEQRDQALSGLLDANALPLLARSAAELARYALERKFADHPVVELSRRVIPGQPWLMSWQPGLSGVASPQLATT